MLLRSAPVLSRPVWAGTALFERYGKPDAAVGESWEVWRENIRPDGRKLGEVVDFPLLIKLISTREVLSVQVHPDDAAAQRFGAPSGKAEAWVILEAEPDAKVALGLRRTLPRETVRQLAADGGIEGELAWFPVHPGMVVDVPCGTIHAIGGGVTLYEVQQPADITWRLYDWGRGRPLHLDHAMTVARCGPAMPPVGSTRGLSFPPLVTPHFTVSLAASAVVEQVRALTVVRGRLRIEHGGERADLQTGESVLVGPGSITLQGEGEALWSWPR